MRRTLRESKELLRPDALGALTAAAALGACLFGSACTARYIDVSCPESACGLIVDRLSDGGGAGGSAAAGTLVAGASFSCASLPQGLFCWGATPVTLELSAGAGASNVAQVQNLSPDAVAAAGDSLCAIAGGDVMCWG